MSTYAMVIGNNHTGRDDRPPRARDSSDRSGLERRDILRLAGIVGTGGVLGLSSIDSAAAVPTDRDDVSKQDVLDDINYGLEHPRVMTTPEQVKNARWNAQNTEWGADLLNSLQELADYMPKFLFELYYDPDYIPSKPFVEMSDEEITGLAPIVGPSGRALYDLPWPDSGTLPNGTASPVDGSDLVPVGMETPGKVKDGEGRVFPGTHDGVKVADEGDGWIVPEDVPDAWAAADYVGETFYPVGVYNAWIVRVMLNALSPIARTYSITQNEKYAHTAARLLDVLATACPNSIGRDLKSDQPAVFYRHGYTAGRILEDFVDAVDLIWTSGELEVDSPTNGGLSIKENITENLIVETAYFCWEDMFGGYGDYEKSDYSRIYHNGTVDYQQAVMMASSLLGLDDVGWAEWTLEGQVSLKNFLSNTVYRDGMYYEIGYGASYTGWADMAYLLRNDTYPDGYDIYDNPRFINLNVEGRKRRAVAGRAPQFGDVHYYGGDPGGIGHTTEPLRGGSFDDVAQFYARADSDAEKADYAQELAELAGGDPNEGLLNNVNAEMGYWEVRDRTWPIFNLKGRITEWDPDDLDIELRDSELLGGKGMAIFRPEEGNNRGAMLRYGSSLSHTHYDELGLWVYGAGREMSYDPGRNPKNTLMPSWWRQTVTHNTAVVNEWSQVPDEDAGGSVHLFSNRTGYTVTDASNDQTYAHEGVDTYRRTVAMLDVDDENSYMVDLFRVDGEGKETVDYSFHGQGVHFDTDLDLSEPADGSVASEDYYWGDMIKDNGLLEGYEGEGFWYNAPPENGYGFLGYPQEADGDDGWSASWELDKSRNGPPAKIRLSMLGDDDHDVIVARGPDPMVWNLGLDEEEHEQKYTLTRDESDGPTQYAGIVEAVESEFIVDSVTDLPVDEWDGEGFEPVAMSVDLDDDRTDYVLSVLEGQFTAKPGRGQNITSDAEFAQIHQDDDGIAAIRMEKGTHLHAKFRGQRPIVIDAKRDSHGGEILEVDYEAPSIFVGGDLPEGDQLADQYVLIDDENYARNSQFRIEHVERENGGSRVYLEDTSFDMSRGTVDEKPEENVIQSPVKFPMANTRNKYVPGDDGNDYFVGKRIENLQTGDSTTIVDVRGDFRSIEVKDASIFDLQDNFVILEIEDGDEATVPLSVDVSREEGGHGYVVNAPTDVDVTIPGR